MMNTPPRPSSVTDFWPNVAIFALSTGTIVACLVAGFHPAIAAFLGAALCLAGLLSIERDAISSGRRVVDGISAPGPKNWTRVRVKLVGLWATLLPLVGLYFALAPWIASEIAVFLGLVPFGLLVIAVISPFLFVETDRRMDAPEDSYYALGRLVMGKADDVPWGELRTHCLGWLVKAFFLPLMISWYVKLVYVIGNLYAQGFDSIGDVFVFSFILLFVMDLLGAVVGYSMTLKIMGTQIKSTNSLVTGWVAGLICYPPMVFLLTALNSNIENMEWIGKLEGQPGLMITLGLLVLFFEVTYALATVNFGLRFSNLTHRGIVTGGLYRWVKHPAYLSKNTFWWMMTIAFIPATENPLWVMLCIAAINTIYFVRAKTEELHLKEDRAYRDYCAWIEEHGLFAPLTRARRRLFALLPSRSGAAPQPK